MGREETFDSFYLATRREVLHQAFVLTGDLPAAQSGVRDAYVAAWHHWRKVARLEDPLEWVRPRAWQLAQHRHSARIWHRGRGISEAHRRVLDAVTKLPQAQRKVLLLCQLAGVTLPQAAREVGLTRDLAEQHLQAATSALATALEVPSTAVRFPLEELAGALGEASLPRASIVRRTGGKRRQWHTLAAVAAAATVAVAAGGVAYDPGPAPAAHQHLVRPSPKATTGADTEAELPSAAQLLDQDQIRRLGLDQDWQVDGTTNNTSGDGINTICQQQRFADPDGLSALVRTFHAVGRPKRSAVQTVEISKSIDQAEKGYATTVGWFAGCRASRLQLLDAYRVDNIGDQADVLVLRAWDRPVTTYSVAVARTGRVTTATVAQTVGGSPPTPRQVTQSLADAVSMLCGRSGAETCAKQPSYVEVPPPSSGRERGVLAVVDLPPVGRIDRPWAATAPQVVGKNPSATSCDRADFAHGGASHVVSRTYLIPHAKVPLRFGLTETYGEFPRTGRAARFLARVRTSVAGCEKRDLATKVVDSDRYRERGMATSLYTFETEISNRETVRFRVGFVRVGRRVTQLNFAPGPHDDMTYAQFRSLLFRAGDRLRELG